MRRRKRKHKYFSMPEINLTPLIDTALTLLLIFMVAAPALQSGIKVDLPKGNSKEVKGKQDLVVTVTKNFKLFFNSFPVEKKDLAAAVKKEMGSMDDIPVYVRADEGISYGKVIEIVDELKQAGVRYVAMSTRAIS